MSGKRVKEQNYTYFVKPTGETCYEYLLGCYGRISADVGEYPAFQIFGCDTPMAAFVSEIDALAAFLYAKGYRENDVAAVFLPTSAHSMTAFYALSKLGVIAEMIHPLTPPGALRGMLGKTGARGVFLLDKAAAPYAGAVGDRDMIVCSFSDHLRGAAYDALKAQEADVQLPEGARVYRYRDAVSHPLPAAPITGKNARDTAVYMHGSGTTGESRTVCLSAYAINAVAYSQYFIDCYHEYGRSYSLCVLPFFHAFGLGAALHYCTCNAYTPILVPKFDAKTVNDLIAKNNVQYISGVPNMFYKMFAADNFENPGLGNLTVLYSGGDIVSEAFIEQFTDVLKKYGSPAKLFRGWGLTEMCAVCSTNNHLASRAGSIGRPGKGLAAKIVDEEMRPLPPGENGEICLTGETMMNGYLDSPESGIVRDEAGVPWVRTGDMGYLDEDGFLFFTGRKKRIIVISGYNVYPYSIEQAIARLPYVREACAVQGYLDGKPCVKLCLSLLPDSPPEEEVRENVLRFCENELDHFSVPRKIVFMEALPRTRMDKLDFMALSDPLPC